jgi:hypothetical protein|tara:strand:+ start:33 stop:536 length:504 start_codon:yes stop_codon:yes gene_type:complete
MKLQNKKGAEKIISVYWFVILIMVAGTITYMVSIFYGQPYDVRDIESNIMMNNVADCLSKDGKLIPLESLKDNFLKECHLNFDALGEGGQYYLEVGFYEFGGSQLSEHMISEGNVNLKKFSEDSPKSNLVHASSKSFYVLNEENEGVPKELTVKIISIISKIEKNVA